MNKKKAVYTSLTALALASFSATTFADEVAETAVAETTVALADEAVAEDTVVEASPEVAATETVVEEEPVAATETVAEEEPVAVTALVEEESIFDKSAIQEQFEAGDTSYIAGTWEKEVTEYDTIPHTISISTDSRVTSIAYPKGYSHDFSRITGSTSSNGIVDENTVLIDSGGASGTFKRVSAEETIFEDIWSWTGLETYDVSSMSDDEFVNSMMTDVDFRSAVGGAFVQFKGTYEGSPYHLVYHYERGGYFNDLKADILASVNLPEDLEILGIGTGPTGFTLVLPDGYIPTLTAKDETTAEETELVSEENNETVAVTDEEVSATEESKEEATNLVVADLSEVNAQIKAGDTSAIAGTWQTEEGELLSISADGKLYSITYPEGHTLKPAQAGESIRSAQLTEDGKLDIANGGAMIYNGKILTRVSEEETTFDKNYWAWTGLENYTYDWSVNSIEFGTTAGEKGGHYHVFRGTYNGVPYELVYFRDTTNDGAPTWSDFNLPDDMKPVGYGVGPNIYYYVLPDGYIPTLTGRRELADSNGTAVTVDVAVSDQVASVEVIDHIEPTEVNPTPIERLAGQDYDLYDITLKDAAGNPITTLKAVAVVKLPVDEGKTVERVIYLPETGVAETLAILKQEDGFVYFEASHFSHYGVVYLQTSTATETAETTEIEEVVTTPTSSDKAVSTIAQGAGQAATSSTSTPSYSRVARAQAEKANAEKKLPSTGETDSVLALIGLGLASFGLIGRKRRYN